MTPADPVHALEFGAACWHANYYVCSLKHAEQHNPPPCSFLAPSPALAAAPESTIVT
jgi:hypothetical protein